ncbi:MAG TPA: ATP-binding protein [Pseudobdellovibrionaceae bacterium]|nr:ATP-binding protein [Pseudobdellovibrionaceae bacterium]
MTVQGQEPRNVTSEIPTTGFNRRPAPTASHRVSKPKGPSPVLLTTVIVIVSVVVAVLGIIWKTREVIEKDRSAFLADSTAKQVSPLRRVVQQRLAQDRARLAQFATARSSLGPGRARAFGDFAMIAMLQPGSSGTWTPLWIEKGPLYSQFQGQIADQQELALLKGLPAGKIREGETYWQRFSDSKGLPIWAVAIGVETQVVSSGAGISEALPEGTDYATRSSSNTNKTVGESAERAVVVGLFGRNPLLTATEDFVGSTSTAWVVDDKGYAATHSNKAQVGALLTNDAMVQKIVDEQMASGASRYTSSEGQPLFGAFEKVDRSNLFVVMTTDERAVLSSGASFAKTAATTGGLAVVVGVLLVMAWSGQLQRTVTVSEGRFAGGVGGGTGSGGGQGPGSGRVDLSAAREAIGSGAATTGFHRTSSAHAETSVATGSGAAYDEAPEPVDEGSGLNFDASRGTFAGTSAGSSDVHSNLAHLKNDSEARVIRERAAAIASFAKGMETTVREPMLAALAHVQLAVEKIQSSSSPEEISEHVHSIEKDLRRAKDAIDEIESLSKEKFVPSEGAMADVAQILRQLCDQSMSWAEAEGVQLQLESARVPILRAEPGALRRALEELLSNARRSLRGRSIKQIQLSLTDTEDAVYVQVSDTGVGMDRDRAAQAFEPFFKGFDDLEARGLGLARVKAIVEGHGGSVELSSRPGEGSTVTIKLPVSPVERAAFRATQSQALASSVASAFASPKGKASEPVAAAPSEAKGASEEIVDRPFSAEDLLTPSPASGVDLGSMSEAGSGLSGVAKLAGHSPLTPEQAAALPQAPRFDRDHEVSFSLTASDIKRLEAVEAEMRQQGARSPSAKSESPAPPPLADSPLPSSAQVEPNKPPSSGRVDVAVRPVATSKIKLNLPAKDEGAAEKPDPNTKS